MLAPVLLLLASTVGATALGPGGSPPLSEAQLEARFVALASPDPQTRWRAAQALIASPAEALPLLARRLLRPRPTPPEDHRKLILAIWGQVPNWQAASPMWVRKPEPPWVPPPRVPGQPRPRRPPLHDPEKVDWLTALNEVDLAEPELAELADPVATRAHALEVVALLRAVSASRRLDAVDPLFRMAFEHEGVFRDECGRQIRAMGNAAVPALIHLRHRRGEPGHSLAKQRRYASYQLDRMDRARPQKAIAAAADDHARAEIIRAYGQERAIDAVEAILNQVDAPSHRVRKEARRAWLSYVAGPAPPPAPKRKRKLPGGREEPEEKADYLTYRELALLALQKQLQAITNAPPAASATAQELSDQLLAYYDEKRAAEWDQHFRAAQAKEQRGDLEGAVKDYGWILAHDPSYAHRREMVPAFLGHAERLRQRGQRGRALVFLREALDLDPTGPHARGARARVLWLDGLAALEEGHPDPEVFLRAVALDPELREARASLVRAESLLSRRRWVLRGEALVALAAVLFGLWLLWRRAIERSGTAAT